MELMLLEDYTYRKTPESILNVLASLRRTNSSPNKTDIIVSFLYLLMLESGFVPKDCSEIVEDSDFNYQRLLRLSKTLPEGWKRSTSYHMDFLLKSAPDAICSVTCIAVSDDLLVNCTIKNVANFSLLVDPLMYFTRSEVSLEKLNFQNLDHLGSNFKNSIAFPAKLAIVNMSGGVCGCFQHLPHELVVKIMAHLDIQGVLSLARTCRNVCQAALNPSLWVKLLSSKFRKRKNVIKSYEELKFIYEIKYAKELNRILESRGRH